MSCRSEVESQAVFEVGPSLSEVVCQLLNLSVEDALALAEVLLEIGFFDEDEEEEEPTRKSPSRPSSPSSQM